MTDTSFGEQFAPLAKRLVAALVTLQQQRGAVEPLRGMVERTGDPDSGLEFIVLTYGEALVTLAEAVVELRDDVEALRVGRD